MLFGFACFCRGCPNNARLFDALGAFSAEGVQVDAMHYIFIKTHSTLPIESIVATLGAFSLRPIPLAEDTPDILTAETSSRCQRQVFFQHIKTNRILYHRGVASTTYWFWREPPFDSMGHPLPPPVGAYEIDTTPSSRWREYWDRCPSGEHSTTAILD
jgi:hypothetical protein